MKAVADVIHNRARKRNKSVCEVVREKGQFSWVRKSTKMQMYDRNTLTVFYNLDKMESVVGDAEYFHSGRKPWWAKGMERVAVVGQHKFYEYKEGT